MFFHGVLVVIILISLRRVLDVFSFNITSDDYVLLVCDTCPKQKE